MKTLIVYFSAEGGNTRHVARSLAEVSGGELYEILPKEPYSRADLNYINPLARCNREHLMKKRVPVAGRPTDLAPYDLILIGFPIWYGHAPNVVASFCEGLDFCGKKVAAFATSGGSGIGKSAQKLAPYVKGAPILDARLFKSLDEKAFKAWISGL